MSLSIGIVGLPNVGKSTLFNALLKKQIALAANYPFATIEPNVGVAEVPDERLSVLAKIVKTQVLKPALVEFTDIAGLIKGASQGEGLGNKFLSHIRETDAICHVLRAFEDDSVIREGSTDPTQDLAIIRTELQIADLETIEKQKEPNQGLLKDKELARRWEVIQEFKQRLEAGDNVLSFSTTHANLGQLTAGQAAQLKIAQELNLLTFKPELFVLNVNEQDLSKAEQLKKEYATLLSTAKSPVTEQQIVVISAQIESELASLASEEQALYLQDLGIAQSGLERLAKVAYDTLGLQSFLTAGELEVKAWTIKKGMTAVEASGVIHTDFVQKFIKAKIISYADFVKYNGWSGAREAGKVRVEGRDYIMTEGDIVEFMIGG